MHTKQTIAIIGASGKMGAAIAKSLSKGNYRLLLMDKCPERAKDLVVQIRSNDTDADIEIIDCYVDASWEADIIIPAIPYLEEKGVAGKIREMVNQKIVISISNPFCESFKSLVTGSGLSAAEELQLLLPHSKVIKAFNTTFAADFASPLISGKQLDAFLAGNDDEALQTVSELISTAGFNPIIAGELPVSRTLENMQLMLVQLNLKYNYHWLAGWKVLHN